MSKLRSSLILLEMITVIENPKLTRFNIVLLSVAVIAFGFPYPAMVWWKFGIATFLVLWSFRASFPNTFIKILGLEMSSKDWIKTSVTLVLVAIISEVVIRMALNGSEVLREPGPIISTWPLQPIFQAGNEEMVARAAA